MLYETNELMKRRIAAYHKRKDALKKLVEELQARIERLHFPTFEEVYKPLCEQVRYRLKAEAYVFYGPFGLCGEMTIYWLKDKSKDITAKGNVLGSLCLVSGIDNGDRIRDKSKDTHEYKNGTIGEMNGMNHPSIEITPEMDFEWLINFVERNEHEGY